MTIGSVIILSGILNQNMTLLVLINIATVSLGIYGLRCLYYALFQEAKLPLAITGSAVGLVSVIGYKPDIFFGALMGVILDNNPGAIGHQYLFGVVALFGMIGFWASVKYRERVASL